MAAATGLVAVLLLAQGAVAADDDGKGLHHFTLSLAPASPEQAGAPFVLTATAKDKKGKTLTKYEGPAAVSGDLGSSVRGCAGPCAPIYAAFGAWVKGRATASVTAYRAETGRTLAVTDSVSAAPAVVVSTITLDVGAGPLATLELTRQPKQTQVGQPINPPLGVGLLATDAYGNAVGGAEVAISIAAGFNPGGGVLSGTTPKTTDASGVVSYTDLAISKTGIGYRLAAASGSVSVLSVPFVIADVVSQCTSTCSASAQISGNVSVSGAATGTSGSQQLGLTLLPASAPPTGACPGFVPLTAGASLDFDTTSGTMPSLTVKLTIPAALVGDAHRLRDDDDRRDVCLGAARLDAGTTGFPTKSGSPAVPIVDPDFGVTRFWGLLPRCKTTAPVNPCIVSQKETWLGDIVITIAVPYPWDPRVWT